LNYISDNYVATITPRIDLVVTFDTKRNDLKEIQEWQQEHWLPRFDRLLKTVVDNLIQSAETKISCPTCVPINTGPLADSCTGCAKQTVLDMHKDDLFVLLKERYRVVAKLPTSDEPLIVQEKELARVHDYDVVAHQFSKLLKQEMTREVKQLQDAAKAEEEDESKHDDILPLLWKLHSRISIDVTLLAHFIPSASKSPDVCDIVKKEIHTLIQAWFLENYQSTRLLFDVEPRSLRHVDKEALYATVGVVTVVPLHSTEDRRDLINKFRSSHLLGGCYEETVQFLAHTSELFLEETLAQDFQKHAEGERGSTPLEPRG
jgi:hypothetical protein